MYCHFPLAVVLIRVTVKGIVSGVGVPVKLLAYLNTCSPVTDTAIASAPLSPLLPCLLQDHENTLLNVLPSIVIGIVNVPLSALKAVPVDTVKLILEFDGLATVIPFALLIVPNVKSVRFVVP